MDTNSNLKTVNDNNSDKPQETDPNLKATNDSKQLNNFEEAKSVGSNTSIESIKMVDDLIKNIEQAEIVIENLYNLEKLSEDSALLQKNESIDFICVTSSFEEVSSIEKQNIFNDPPERDNNPNSNTTAEDKSVPFTLFKNVKNLNKSISNKEIKNFKSSSKSISAIKESPMNFSKRDRVFKNLYQK